MNDQTNSHLPSSEVRRYAVNGAPQICRARPESDFRTPQARGDEDFDGVDVTARAWRVACRIAWLGSREGPATSAQTPPAGPSSPPRACGVPWASAVMTFYPMLDGFGAHTHQLRTGGAGTEAWQQEDRRWGFFRMVRCRCGSTSTASTRPSPRSRVRWMSMWR